MSANHDDRDQVIADYVRGALDEETARRLEIEMLEDQALFARIQAEALLHQGLAQHTEQPHRRPERARAPQARRWFLPALAGALSLTVAVLGVRNVMLHDQLRELRAPAPGVPVITLFDERSPLIEPAGEAAIGATGGVLIEIDVSAHEAEWFELEVITGTGTRRWRQLRADGRGYLTVYVPDAEALQAVSVLAPDGTVLRHHGFGQTSSR